MKKITKSKILKYFSFSILTIGLIIPIPLLIYSSTSNTRNFVLGNYQSYMAPVVMNQLTKSYGLEFDYFETSEDVKKLLKNNIVDIANTTSYDLIDLINEKLVSKIDWTKFNINMPNQNNPAKMIPINSANDALALFTPSTQEVLTAYTINNNPVNLLDYGIPYFIQDLVFVYRGQRIEQLHNNNVKWSDVLDVLVTEPRFKATDNPKIVSLDDKRTIYSIPRSIQTNPSDINPTPNATINEIQDTYTILANKLNALGNNSINLNSDSNAVLNLIASGQMAGGIMFNGDAIYASYGGDNGISILEEDFHVVRPIDTVVALDLMVINNKMDGQAKLDKTYDIFKSLCLNDGNFIEADIKPDTPSLTYENFDYVNYTPTLNAMYDYVYNNYFDVWQQPMAKVSINSNKQIELPIDDLLKSNFNFAWTGFKNILK